MAQKIYTITELRAELAAKRVPFTEEESAEGLRLVYIAGVVKPMRFTRSGVYVQEVG